jgi:hypothetical protein
MVEIGRVRVKAGNAPIEQKISAYPPQADICAFVSTSLETKRAARRPPGSEWLRTALGHSRRPDGARAESVHPPRADICLVIGVTVSGGRDS